MPALAYAAGMAELRIKNVPENLHKQFKLLCVEESISINQKVIDLLRQAVAGKGKPK